MAEVLELYIKDVIAAYPPVGEVLEKAGIGCVTCSVGTCLLRDVVGIHNLSESREQELFAAIAAVIFPGKPMPLPKTERKPLPAGNRTLSPPLAALVREHDQIKRVLALLPVLGDRIRNGLDPESSSLVAQVLEFIRHYADRYHHAKEEDILFAYFDAGSDILKVMHKEHEIGRQHVRNALAALEQGNAAEVQGQLSAYGALLREHIRKEDEILYPWMNSQLSDTQIGRLFSQFSRVDGEFEAGVRVQLGRVETWEKEWATRRSGES